MIPDQFHLFTDKDCDEFEKHINARRKALTLMKPISTDDVLDLRAIARNISGDDSSCQCLLTLADRIEYILDNQPDEGGELGEKITERLGVIAEKLARGETITTTLTPRARE